MTASVKVVLYTDDRNDRASVECVLRILFGAKAPHHRAAYNRAKKPHVACETNYEGFFLPMEESDSICDEITIAVTDSYPNISKSFFVIFPKR